MESAMPEWTDANFGTVNVLEKLPTEESDAGLQRVVLRIDDHTLGGLLNKDPVECSIKWEDMPRG